jgi:hypothetical protein
MIPTTDSLLAALLPTSDPTNSNVAVVVVVGYGCGFF